MKRISTRLVVEAGIMIALASVLSLIKVYSAPQGGSVTAGSMIPILVFALRWGPKPGLIVGVAYGMVQMLLEPFVVHPIQAILDYPLAFGLLGLAGVSRRIPSLGVVLGIGGRIVCHVAAGVVFFGHYAPEGTPALLYSLVYNASYLVPEVLISAVVIHLMSTVRVLDYGRPGPSYRS